MSGMGIMPGEWDHGQLGIYRGESGGMPDEFWKQKMAAALMNNQGAQGANAGLANAGNALAGAYAMKRMQDPTDQGQAFMKQRMAAAGTPMGNTGWLGKLFSLGGGQ